jgi:hypothetical protein
MKGYENITIKNVPISLKKQVENVAKNKYGPRGVSMLLKEWIRKKLSELPESDKREPLDY